MKRTPESVSEVFEVLEKGGRAWYGEFRIELSGELIYANSGPLVWVKKVADMSNWQVEDAEPEKEKPNIQAFKIIREGEHPEVRCANGYKKAIHKLAYKELIYGYVYDCDNGHYVCDKPFTVKIDNKRALPHSVLVDVSGFKEGGE